MIHNLISEIDNTNSKLFPYIKVHCTKNKKLSIKQIKFLKRLRKRIKIFSYILNLKLSLKYNCSITTIRKYSSGCSYV